MMNYKFIKNQLGYTLMEILVVCAIATFVAAAMFAAARVGHEQSAEQEVKMSVQDSAREGMYKMLQEIRQTAPDKLTISNGGNTIAFYIPDKDNPTSENYTVDWTGATQVQYAVGGTNNQQLIRTNLTTGTTQVMANNVTGIAFSNTNGGNMVNVTLSIAKDAYNGRTVPGDWLSINGEAELRNMESDDSGSGSGDDDSSDDHSSEDVDDDSSDDVSSDDDSSDDDSSDDHSSEDVDDDSSDDDSSDDDSSDDHSSSDDDDHSSIDDDDDSDKAQAEADKIAAEKAAAAQAAADKAAADKEKSDKEKKKK